VEVVPQRRVRMTKRGGLGRGLSALIPGAAEEGGSGLLQVPVGAIAPNPRQPRSVFDDETLDALARSIQEVGVLQPVVVRRSSGGFELIAGERRLRAARKAGLATIPVIVRESDDAESLREALIENIHREDLNPIELAEAFRELLEELGLKQETLAERLGVSRSHVANMIRLLQLPAEVQGLLADGTIQAGHGRALLSLAEGETQRSLALRAAAEALSVRDVEELVRRYLDQPSPATTGAKQEPAAETGSGSAGGSLAEVEEILSEQLATRVTIQMGKKRGRIVVEFGSADDLERIVSEIVGSGPGLSPD
jgi:ParB family transcriptional regulator, chromosome partitioning protein